MLRFKNINVLLPDWYIISYLIWLQVLVIVGTVSFAYYAYYYFDHLHFNVTHGYASLGYASAQHQVGQRPGGGTRSSPSAFRGVH